MPPDTLMVSAAIVAKSSAPIAQETRLVGLVFSPLFGPQQVAAEPEADIGGTFNCGDRGLQQAREQQLHGSGLGQVNTSNKARRIFSTSILEDITYIQYNLDVFANTVKQKIELC